MAHIRVADTIDTYNQGPCFLKTVGKLMSKAFSRANLLDQLVMMPHRRLPRAAAFVFKGTKLKLTLTEDIDRHWSPPKLVKAGSGG